MSLIKFLVLKQREMMNELKKHLNLGCCCSKGFSIIFFVRPFSQTFASSQIHTSQKVFMLIVKNGKKKHITDDCVAHLILLIV